MMMEMEHISVEEVYKQIVLIILDRKDAAERTAEEPSGISGATEKRRRREQKQKRRILMISGERQKTKGVLVVGYQGAIGSLLEYTQVGGYQACT